MKPTPTFVAWLLMVALTCLSVFAAHLAHAGLSRGAMSAEKSWRIFPVGRKKRL